MSLCDLINAQCIIHVWLVMLQITRDDQNETFSDYFVKSSVFKLQTIHPFTDNMICDI